MCTYIQSSTSMTSRQDGELGQKMLGGNGISKRDGVRSAKGRCGFQVFYSAIAHHGTALCSDTTADIPIVAVQEDKTHGERSHAVECLTHTIGIESLKLIDLPLPLPSISCGMASGDIDGDRSTRSAQSRRINVDPTG